MSHDTSARSFEVHYVDDVPKPPKAPPIAAPAAADQESSRPRDYLEGFLSRPPAAQGGAPGSAEAGGEGLREAIVAALREIYDPEIPVNIYDLGLVYDIAIADGHVTVTMTLTTPHCPVAESLPAEVELRVLAVPGVASAEVKITWDPPWSPALMSDEARLELGML